MKKSGFTLIKLLVVILILGIIAILIVNKIIKEVKREAPEMPTTYTVYANGTAIYFDPTTGVTCTSGESVSATGTKTGCMKWYTFSDAGDKSDTINLILDHNTTAVVAWNSTGSNVSGPTNVMTQLASDTSSWVGVPTRTDNYSLSNGIATYTINYSTYKARLITAAEIETIASTGASNYDWLFDYTNVCTSSGCTIADVSNYGYWTSTAVSFDTGYAYCTYKLGNLINNNVGRTDGYGVRPVITINKSSL